MNLVDRFPSKYSHTKMKDHPKDKELIQCHSCEANFVNIIKLDKHVTSVHLENKKFVCDTCNIGFSIMVIQVIDFSWNNIGRSLYKNQHTKRKLLNF